MWKFLAFAATVLVACSSGGTEDAAEPPGVPGNVQASLQGAEVLVTWDAPSLPDDQPVIQYLISDGKGALISAPPGRPRATFPQPPAGVIYEISVRAETVNGIGDPSEPIAVTGRPGPALVPEQPIVEARGLRGFVEVVWTPPENDGGSLITGFVIEVESTGRSYTFIGNPGTGYFLATNPSIRASGSGTPARFSVVLPDLNPGESYMFRVIAENAIGRSEPSGLTEPIIAGIGYGASNPPVVSISPGPIPPTRTPTPTPLPTSTPKPPTVIPTPRPPTSTPVPPTATAVPTAVPTPTRIPITPTATPVPTPTPVPTATPVPPAIVVTWTQTLFGDSGSTFRILGVTAASSIPTEPITIDIEWGDGISQTAGFIDINGAYGAQVFGSGSVFASHTYLIGGAFTVTVTVSGAFSPTGEAEFVVLIS
jgi:hypothetical protein